MRIQEGSWLSTDQEAGLHQTQNLLDLGDIEHQGTGELIGVNEFLASIKAYENFYGESLQYVKDYVTKVYGKFLSEQDHMFKEASDVIDGFVELDDDDLDLDGFELTDDDVYGKNGKTTLSDAGHQYKADADDVNKQIVDVSNIETETNELNNLLIKINEIKQAIDDKTQAFINEGDAVDQIVGEEVGLLNHLLSVLEQIYSTVNDTIVGMNKLNNTNISDATIEDDDSTPATRIDDTTAESRIDYALNATILETNSILNEISNKIDNNQPFTDVVDSLNNAVTALKNVANGIVQHQKAQQTDKSAASAKIAGNYDQLSSIASNAVASFGSATQIKQMKALADGVVRVEGAVQSADGVWKGFTVDINDSNSAVIRAVDEQSAYADALNKAAEAAKKTEKENSAENKFAKSLAEQSNAFNEYKNNLKDVDYLSDSLKEKIDNLGVALKSISNEDNLSDWKDSFANLKDDIDLVATHFTNVEKEKLKVFRGTMNSEFKTLDFSIVEQNPTDEQREILDLREKLIMQLDTYNAAIQNGKRVELDSLNATMSELREKISLYRQANDLESGS